MPAYAATWLAALEDAGRSPNTLRTNMSILRAHILPPLGDLSLAAVNTDTVRARVRRVAPGHPRTRVNAYRALQSMLAHAHNAGLVTDLPASIRGATTVPPLTESQREARERIGSPEQIDEIAARMPAGLAIAVHLAG